MAGSGGGSDARLVVSLANLSPKVALYVEVRYDSTCPPAARIKYQPQYPAEVFS